MHGNDCATASRPLNPPVFQPLLSLVAKFQALRAPLSRRNNTNVLGAVHSHTTKD